jgi:hypothetical protein
VAERHLARGEGGALAPQHTESVLARDHVMLGKMRKNSLCCRSENR